MVTVTEMFMRTCSSQYFIEDFLAIARTSITITEYYRFAQIVILLQISFYLPYSFGMI